jgi:hypothetical protein
VPQRNPSRPRDLVARYVPALHDALERRVRARFAVSLHRLDVSDHPRVLPRATCLLLVSVRKLRSLHNHLAERDLRTPRRAGNAVLALHSLDLNHKVELAHSRYDCLTQFRKCEHALRMRNERRTSLRVFLLEPVQCTKKVGSFIPNRLDR